jgi:GNAT superfamily N-acetyltransferase
MQVQPLPADDIEAVVQLHREALGYSLNSRLGTAHLARLYAAMRCEPSSLVVTVNRQGVPVGVASATLDPARLRQRLLNSLTLRQRAALVQQLIGRPRLWLDWYESLRLGRPVRYANAVVRPCLTAIAVAAGSRREGIGTALVSAVEEFLHAYHCAAYYLDTRRDNAASLGFYKRLKFVEVEARGRAVVLVKDLAGGPRPA